MGAGYNARWLRRVGNGNTAARHEIKYDSEYSVG
jgi:hypothetical protein